MKTPLRILASAVILSQLPSVGWSKGSDQENEDWRNRMRTLSTQFEELLIDLSVPSRFDQPKFKSTIQTHADRLAQLAHEIGVDQNQDQSSRIYAQALKEDAEHGAAMLKAGHRAYARNILRGVSASCVACHSRMPGLEFGAPSAPTAASVELMKTLPSEEKLQYLSATRRFDEAVQEAEELLKNKSLRAKDPIAWEKSVRQGIALLVRVKENPELAMGWLERLLTDPDTPEFLRIDARAWMRSLKQWKQETSQQLTPKKSTETEASLWKKIDSLQKKARAEQAYPADRSADMDWMRVASLLTRFFREYPSSPRIADALLLQGTTEEALRSNEAWGLSESFYTACIRVSPHSETARKCYRSLEEKVLLGWTGSAGVDVPEDVEMRLGELRSLSAPEKNAPPSPSLPAKP